MTKFCESGSAAGKCSVPRGIAVNPATGGFYLANQENLRVDEFTAWGEFVRGWGWDVVATGPGDDVTVPEDQFEICVPANGDVCKAGLPGTGAGQFGAVARAQGIALDSGGNIYVVDRNNRRVQKFAPSGQFLLMFGGNVNQGPSNPGNVCTAADIAGGDVCGAGATGPPPNPPGQFGGWPVASFIAVAPGDKIYVGDQTRIQRFNASGVYQDELALPVGKEFVGALAADPSGNLYVGFAESAVGLQTEPNVLKLSSAGAEICTAQAADPTAVATDAAGNLYLVDGIAVAKFDSACGEDSSFRFSPGLDGSTGLATSSACGIDGADILVSNADQSNSFVAIYGPPPDTDICPPPEVPPSIEDQYTVSADAGGAVVRASINPHFWPDTTYYVQYGTDECSKGGCQQQPTPGALLTGGIVNAGVTTAGVFLTGLAPDTTYHYRFVAESSGGGPAFGKGGTETTAGEEGVFRTFPLPPVPKTNCSNQVFRIGSSAPLPDCRAYEMVSPVDKNNGDISTGVGGFSMASTDGGRATFASYRAFADPEAAPFRSQYLAERNHSTGWSSRSISPPRNSIGLYPSGGTAMGIQFKAFSGDLCSAWVLQDVDIALVPGAPPGVPNLYRRDNCNGNAYDLITTVPPPGFELEPFDSTYLPEIQGFSSDASHSVFRADAALTDDACVLPAGAEKGLFQVYESVGGQLHLVSMLPDGTPACTHSSVGTAQGLEGNFTEDSLTNAVSPDGSRVFWTTTEDATPVPDGGSLNQPGRLYLRVNATEPQSAVGGGICTEPGKACTYEVSELVTPDAARFVSADAGGAGKAIFLIEDGPLSGRLFEYRFDPVFPEATELAKGVRGIVGASADGSRIYLVSTDVLSGEDENSEGDKAAAGVPNLYLYDGGFRFIGTLTVNETNRTANRVTVNNVKPKLRSSRVTSNGLQVAFMSAARLTGYDNTDIESGEADAEVFLYDATANSGAGDLICVSCNPSGARPVGAITSPEGAPLWATAQIPGWAYQLHPSRALSEDGQRLFFESFEALVLRDTNDAQDVYEWQRAGSREACEEELGGELFIGADSGCLSLISSGQSPEDSEFIDASADGSSAFIATNASLLPQDPGLIDIYAARTGGGFPTPLPPEPGCEGEACQNPPPPPTGVVPASSAFVGKGNPRPGVKRRCPKGKRRVRRGGKTRCVPRRKKARRHGHGKTRRAQR